MFDFLKKEKKCYEATLKTLGSVYSYSNIQDTILIREPADGLSEMQFEKRLEELMYKFGLEKVDNTVDIGGIWQVELKRS